MKRWKQSTENLYRRERRMKDTSKEGSYEKEHVILESKVNAALNVLGRNKSPGVDGIPIDVFQARDCICQNPNKMSAWKTKQ